MVSSSAVAGVKARARHTVSLPACFRGLCARSGAARNCGVRPWDASRARVDAGRLWMNHVQVQEFLKGVEVAVAVEQGVMVLDAERGDEAVDGLSNRSAPRAEVAEVAGGGIDVACGNRRTVLRQHWLAPGVRRSAMRTHRIVAPDGPGQRARLAGSNAPDSLTSSRDVDGLRGFRPGVYIERSFDSVRMEDR